MPSPSAKPQLTLRRLQAIEGALLAMLAGEVGQGDWPEDVSFEDMDGALSWVSTEIAKRKQNKPA